MFEEEGNTMISNNTNDTFAEKSKPIENEDHRHATVRIITIFLFSIDTLSKFGDIST